MECLTDQLASSGRTLLVEGGAAEGMYLDPISPLLYYNGLTSILRPSKYKKAKQNKILFDGEPVSRIPLHICADRWDG